jgi:hypothetical protein
MQQCITRGPLVLVRRTLADVDHWSIAISVDLFAAASVCRADPSF